MFSNDGRKNGGWNDGNDGTIIMDYCPNTLLFVWLTDSSEFLVDARTDVRA